MTTTYEQARTDLEKAADEACLARVKAGIELLQEKYGRDWVEKIDLESFDIGSPTHCVLGQVYSNDARLADPLQSGYEYGRKMLYPGRPSFEYGFDGADTIRLQRVWKQEINARKRPINA